MKTMAKDLTVIAALCVVAWTSTTQAQTLITDFNNFFENELYASWNSTEAIINSGPDSYTVTATGYGSNYTYIGNLGILGAGNTHLELDITLSGPPEADGFLGPIITLVDADGSSYNYAWYGQTLGDHLLTKAVTAPTWIGNAGTIPGLDLDMLLHMHMQLDPGEYGAMGPYTVEWKNLNLITIEGTPGDFDGDGDVDGNDFLLWQQDTSVGSLTDWQTNFGTSGPMISAVVQSVPEPTTVELLLLSGLSLLVGKRFHWTR